MLTTNYGHCLNTESCCLSVRDLLSKRIGYKMKKGEVYGDRTWCLRRSSQVCIDE